jgi:hypothetical protein
MSALGNYRGSRIQMAQSIVDRKTEHGGTSGMWGLMRKWLNSFKPPIAISRYLVVEFGVAVERTDQTKTVLFNWDDVHEIQTCKVDLFTYDDVRLMFRTSNSWCVLSEEVAGFVDVMSTMQNRFPAIPQDWYRTVREGASKENRRELWPRPLRSSP